MAGVAGRYAAALFELATEQNSVAEIERDLGQFASLYDGSEDLRRLVRSPVISADDQGAAMAAVLAKAGVGAITTNFFKLIAKNRRLSAAPDMARAFQGLAARARGEVTANVTSATALNDGQVAALKSTLKEGVGKDVRLSTHVDPSLLGGLVVKIGSRMIDSSLRTKLANMKAALTSDG